MQPKSNGPSHGHGKRLPDLVVPSEPCKVVVERVLHTDDLTKMYEKRRFKVEEVAAAAGTITVVRTIGDSDRLTVDGSVEAGSSGPSIKILASRVDPGATMTEEEFRQSWAAHWPSPTVDQHREGSRELPEIVTQLLRFEPFTADLAKDAPEKHADEAGAATSASPAGGAPSEDDVEDEESSEDEDEIEDDEEPEVDDDDDDDDDNDEEDLDGNDDDDQEDYDTGDDDEAEEVDDED